MKETQLDVLKKKKVKKERKWKKGRGGADFREINAVQAHTLLLISAYACLFCIQVGTWTPRALSIGVDLQSSIIKQRMIHLPTPWRKVSENFTRRFKS